MVVPSKIKPLRSWTSGATPSHGLSEGTLALNIEDERMWVGVGTNADPYEIQGFAVNKFLELLDTPNNFAGAARNVPTVSDAEDSLVFTSRENLFDSNNLIVNNSVEDWSDTADMPANWTYVGSNEDADMISKETTTTFNGINALRNVDMISSGYSRGSESAEFDLPHSGDLIVGGYVNIPDYGITDGVDVVYRVYFYDSSGAEISYEPNMGTNITTPNEWHMISNQVSIPADARTAKFVINVKSNDSGAEAIHDQMFTYIDTGRIPHTTGDLDDVSAIDPSDGDLLSYDMTAGEWGPVSGDTKYVEEVTISSTDVGIAQTINHGLNESSVAVQLWEQDSTDTSVWHRLSGADDISVDDSTPDSAEVTFGAEGTYRIIVMTGEGIGGGSGGDGASTVQELGTISGTVDIDVSQGTQIRATLGNDTTFTFSGSPDTGNTLDFDLRLTDADTNAITWPSGTLFAGSVAPDIIGSLCEIPCQIDANGVVTVYGVIDDIGQ